MKICKININDHDYILLHSLGECQNLSTLFAIVKSSEIFFNKKYKFKYNENEKKVSITCPVKYCKFKIIFKNIYLNVKRKLHKNDIQSIKRKHSLNENNFSSSFKRLHKCSCQQLSNDYLYKLIMKKNYMLKKNRKKKSFFGISQNVFNHLSIQSLPNQSFTISNSDEKSDDSFFEY